MAPLSGSRINRSRQPELEADFHRTPSLGFDPKTEVGLIRCLAHGYPTPLARWHCHEEYELHIITETSGKAFVGDWIGPFEPGHVTLRLFRACLEATLPAYPERIAGNGEVWSAGLTPAGTPSPIKVIELSHGSRAHRA